MPSSKSFLTTIFNFPTSDNEAFILSHSEKKQVEGLLNKNAFIIRGFFRVFALIFKIIHLS